EKVFPEEVEIALKSHPGVYDAVVIGLPDDRFGERVSAVVQRRRGTQVDASALELHCREKLADFKVPRRIVFVDEVARRPTGKADLVWARRQVAENTD
ncbi:MAG: acyl-CoA synthetase, partial [Acidimicrobiales bacterium]|nr:acyl-CoA synthetase [Acidimicrobiales bacterium]